MTSLKTNALVDPLGIGVTAPSLSWQSTSSGRSVTQKAYEIRVDTSADSLPRSNAWASGRVDSDRQIGIRYDGSALESQTRYFWQVRIWTDAGIPTDWSAPAWFETGLRPADWQADWIGSADPSAEMARWSNYSVSLDFTLDSVVIGMYARARDLQNGYMMQLSVAQGFPQFRPHVKRNGNFAMLGNGVDLSGITTVAALTTGTHNLTVDFAGTTITSFLDGTQIDQRTDTTFSQGYIGFRQTMVGEGPENSTIHKIVVESPENGTLLRTDFSDGQNPFAGGSVVNGAFKAFAPLDTLMRAEPAQPLLRKEFSVAKEVVSARVYASARGVYELSINGKRVGDELLAPGMTEYKKRIDYQSYDVTDLVKQGGNAIGAKLGTGWYAGHVGQYGTGIWGNRTSLIAQLRIDYSDGSHSWVKTDNSWKTAAGPLVESDIIMGEVFDARRMQDGWDTANFADTAWKPVGVADNADTAKLVAARSEPVRVTEERTPIERTEPTPGTWIYDMGQNMVGVGRFELTGKAGTTATIRYGELLKADGTLYTENLRTAKATDTFTFAADGTASYTPTFTFHGFRYAEITGVTEPSSVDQVTGLVWGSDLPTTGTLETSSSMLNQLQSNIVWGQRGNFLSIPTDTPARDERLAWTGDINVFAPTASYNQDTRNFLGAWLGTLADSQGGDGDLPGVAPNIVGRCCGGGSGWSDAGITLPYILWQSYGDSAVIHDNYAMMKNFMAFVERSAGPSLIRVHGNTGDWLDVNDPTDLGLLGTAYYYYSADLLSQMAAEIGETTDAEHYAELAKRVQTAFLAKYLATDGTMLGNSQTAYAISIGMGLIPADRLKQVGDKYVAAIAARDYHLSTGFLGTPWLLTALTKTGHQDLAYRLLNNDTYPSWGYEVALGATTMWERWDAIKPDGTVADGGMNSFNHYAYGAVGNWMYQNIGGITSTSAGYKTFDIAPTPGGGLTHGKGTFDSVFGMISSSWDTTENGLTLAASVPVNTTATVTLPIADGQEVTENGVAIDEVEGVTSVSTQNGVAVLEVGSGDYSFAVAKPVVEPVADATVSFDSQGGSAVAPIVTTSGTAIAAPVAPKRTGYTFAGWHTTATGSSAWAFTSPVTVDVTLYAHWTVQKRTVTFNAQGGSTVAAVSTNYNTVIKAPKSPTRTGYTFAGWHTTATGSSAWAFTSPVTVDVTLYAHWTVQKRTVTFNAQGGSKVAAVSTNYNTAIKAPKSPTRTGYTFKGWYTKATGGSKWNFTAKVTSNATAYAHWTVQKRTVTFNAQGGSKVAAVSTNYNTVIKAPKSPTRSGYVFKGWYTKVTGGTAWKFTAKVTTNATAYAHWAKK
ncbi:alpha-L-rhamnosidase [Leifsonia kafniensis]|uniref:alpha-L-rhamnosidase n=1 Tax=Leifsonia kafniensis TaxID=475957 RepID=A0ABP7KJF5_9MICO